MKSWRDTLIGPETPILEALRVVDDASLKVALVVDKRERLLGLVTDGDVRRGILSDVPLDDPVSMIMTPNPLVASIKDSADFVATLMENRVIDHLPVVDTEGRVVDLKTRSGMSKPLPNSVVLMAGGEGRRLRPLTEDFPKPLLSIGERPLLETTIIEMAGQGFTKFFVSINYMGQKIREHFGDGSNLGVSIHYLEEAERMGTAGSLTLLPEAPEHPLVVVNGDVLTKVSYRDLLQFHSDSGACATMCVSEYNLTVPYGVAMVRNKHLIGFDEKPTRSYLINAGIYVLSPAALDVIPKGSPFDMTSVYQKLLEQRRNVIVFPIREYWTDIGKLDDFDRARGDYEEVFE